MGSRICFGYVSVANHGHSRSYASPCLGPRALPTSTYTLRDRVRVWNRELQATQRGGGHAHDACRGEARRDRAARVRLCLVLIQRVSFMAPWQSEILDRHGVRLNVLGRRELFPLNVQAAIKKAENMTRHNNACVCFLLSPFLLQA